MLRAIAVVGLIVGLVAAVVFGPRMLGDASENLWRNGASVQCNLLEEGPCRWSNYAGTWEVSLTRLDDAGQNREYRLTVTTPERPERFLAVLKGESMYMGEYPVPLGNHVGDQYSARFTAPLCTEDTTMTWRIDLQHGQDPIEDIPVKLVFQAEPR